MGRPTIYRIYLGLVILHAMGAYSLGPVPIQWIALAGFIAMATRILISRSHVPLPPGFSVLVFFLFFALSTSLINIAGSDVAHLLPERATTSYFGYISLRFLNLIAFIAAMFCTYTVASLVSVERLSEDIAMIGVVVSLYAFYIYIAQISGWPEPPRTRVGTDGGTQTVVFSYAFHRAMGSFREPSHLAEWLVLPFFLSVNSRRHSVAKSFVILAALLLTGSLTGTISVCVGLAGTALVHLRRIASFIAKTYRLALPLAGAALIFTVVAKTGSGYGGFVDTLWRRIEPLVLESDVKKTNRDYVYRYYEEHRASIFGEGIGNANIIFTNRMHVDSTVSFLNLYVNTLFSLGYLGAMILAFVLLYPFWLRLMNWRSYANPALMMIWGAYFAWLTVFSAHSEELSPQFGMLYGLMIFSIAHPPQQRTV